MKSMPIDYETVFDIQRYCPEQDAAPRWEQFAVRTRPGMTILEGLHQIREEQDSSLVWRSSCRMGICGSCGMSMNGQPGLACNTQIFDVDQHRIRLQPLLNFDIVKDLVPDLAPMFERHTSLTPYLVRDDQQAVEGQKRELEQTPEQLLEYMQFSYCIKCGACMAACPTMAIDEKFLGPMPLAAVHRYNNDNRDDGFDERRQKLGEHHSFPHCHYAGECSRVCPKGVDPARAIQLMKRDLIMDMFHVKRQKPAGLMAEVEPKRDRNEGLQAPDFTVDRKSGGG